MPLLNANSWVQLDYIISDTDSHSDDNIHEMQTAVEVFKRIILEMEKADGNAPPEEKKCAVM